MSLLKRKKQTDKTILAITDFSKNSTNAILFAAHLFKNVNLNIKLLHVFENPNEKAALLISIEDIVAKDSEIGLKAQSAEIAAALNNLPLKISTYSISGKLKKAIGGIIQSENIDMIVSGISSNKYPKQLNNTPLLFMGQSKFPILLVPENCSQKPLKNILVLNLDAHLKKNNIEEDFKRIVNHNHTSVETIAFNERKIDASKLSLLYASLEKNDSNLLLVIPSAGDKIDRALLDYQVQELYSTLATLLSY